MEGDKGSTSAQLRDDTRPAASPLGTDDEAAGTTPTADRIAMAQQAEKKIGGAAKRKAEDAANDDAHSQRGSSAPYGKEEHMNEELVRQKASVGDEEDPS